MLRSCPLTASPTCDRYLHSFWRSWPGPVLTCEGHVSNWRGLLFWGLSSTGSLRTFIDDMSCGGGLQSLWLWWWTGPLKLSIIRFVPSVSSFNKKESQHCLGIRCRIQCFSEALQFICYGIEIVLLWPPVSLRQVCHQRFNGVALPSRMMASFMCQLPEN